MNDYRFPENSVTKLCFPLLLLALQIVARSTMFTSTFLGFGLSQAIMLGLVLLIGLLFLMVNRKRLKPILLDRRMLAFGCAAVLILGPMLVKRDWQAMYFTILLCWLFAIFLTYFTTVQALGRWYVLIFLVLGIWTLTGIFVLKPLVQAGILPGFPFDSPGGWKMQNFGLTFVSILNEEGDRTFRAFGIFREPGLYQVFLFVAIQLNNYWVQWKRERQMWAVNGVLFAALLVTFATGGVIALMLYIVFLFFDKGLYRDKKLRILAMVLLIAGVAALGVAFARDGSWAYELAGMVEKIVKRTDSYLARVDSVAANAEIFLQHPVFGGKLSEVMYSTTNNTTTSPMFFAIFGVVTGCVHVLSWAAFAWKKERSVVMNLILMVILFIPFNTQNVIHDMFFWMFPVMALTQWCLPRLDNIRKPKKV